MYGASKVTAARGNPRSLVDADLLRTEQPARRSSDQMLRVTTGRFRPEIDGLRFFAIVPVLFSHLFQQVLRRQHQLGFLGDIGSSGYHRFVNHLPGVLLFFAISGYILTYQVMNAAKGGYGWAKYRTYILRRFRRIAPPYYIILGATFVVTAIIGFRPSGGKYFEASSIPLFPSLIASLFYSHWTIYQEWPRLFGAGWTLEIETQYYVIAPVLTLSYLTIASKRARVALGVVAVVLSSALASRCEIGGLWSGTIVKFFPYFLSGMLAMDLQDDFQQIARLAPRQVTDLLTVIVLFLYLRIPSPEEGYGIKLFDYYVVNLLCVMAMFAAVSLDGNVLRRVCINRYVVIIGGACYSIYLTHYQVIFLLMNVFYRRAVFHETALAMAVNAAIEAPVAILVGLTFYRLIERPFMMWGRR